MFKFSEDTRESYPELMDREFTWRQLEEVYRDIVDKEAYQCFDAWMYDMRRNGLILMGFPKHEELQAYAMECSKTIIFSTSEGEVKREADEDERQILYNLIFGGLLSMRHYLHDAEKGSESMNIAGTVEYIADVMIPDLQGYETVYIPIKRYFAYYKREEG